jgi:hypothetical protein
MLRLINGAILNENALFAEEVDIKMGVFEIYQMTSAICQEL